MTGTPLRSLVNIGEKLEEALLMAGIPDAETLRTLGGTVAWRRLGVLDWNRTYAACRFLSDFYGVRAPGKQAIMPVFSEDKCEKP